MYKKPFKYDEQSQRVVDANGIDVCMMRGWSDLRKQLGPCTAIDVQGHFGGMIATLLNEYMGKDLPSEGKSDQK